MYYTRLCEGLNTKGTLVPSDDVFNRINDTNKDWYVSLYEYDENHYQEFQKRRSVAGITNTTANKLYFDFDSESDLDKARHDALELCSKLTSHGIPMDALDISFTGNKGFAVEVEIDKRLTPEEFEAIVLNLGSGLSTFDPRIKDPNRIIRVKGTRHNVSKLYKIPLTLQELTEMPSELIKEKASDPSQVVWDSFELSKAVLPDSIYNMTKKTKKENRVTEIVTDLDFKAKPRGMPNCKFAILNGYFPNGRRSDSLTALASSLKYMGYPKEVTYNMLKAAARLQGERTNSEAFSKKEIWDTIIKSVFGSNWKGGQYSCKSGKDPWLTEICDSLGPHKCPKETKVFTDVTDMKNIFGEYIKNIDQNTIKTGVPQIDNNIQLTIGMSVGILGAPSSGKTSLALNILKNSSLIGVNSLFISLDMHSALVYQKQMQTESGRDFKGLQKLYIENPKEFQRCANQIDSDYKNVKYSTRSGQTMEDIRRSIQDYEEDTGQKLKLVLIDYLECLQGPYSDSTANTALIANQLKDLANDLNLCVITLVQPQKSAGDASAPLTSMRKIKGSSVLEQAFGIILAIFRPGFSPDTVEDDRFIVINAVKNRLGSLFSVPCLWDGVRGTISDLPEELREEYNRVREMSDTRRNGENSSNDGWS